MRRTILTLALLGVIAVPATGQENLLLNPGFDVVSNNASNPQFPNAPLNETIWLGYNYPCGLPNSYCEYPKCDEVADPDWCYQDCGEITGCVDPDVDPTCCDARDPACMEAGAPEPCCCTDPCNLSFGGWGSRSHPVPSRGVAPEYQAWEAASSGEELVTDTYQTIKTSVGATSTLQGYVHTGPSIGTEINTITINVFDGHATSGTKLGTITIDETLAAGGWYPFSLTTSPVTTEEYVTVHWQTTTNAPYGSAGAVHCEDFSLTSDQTCMLQHDLGTSPTIDPTGDLLHDTTTAVTITGDADRANMDRITSVKLIQVETETVIECTDVVATADTVSFNAPIGTETSGYPLGDYLVLAEQADCVGQTIVDGLTVTCADPTTLGSMSPDNLQLPQESTELTITGAGLDELNSVSLWLGSTEISGYSMYMSGDNLKVSFNLTDALPGVYSLTATRADACANPKQLAQALTLTPGFSGVEVLFNGDFEAEGPQPPETEMMPSSGWVRIDGQWNLRYNETLTGHTVVLPPGPVAGDNWGAVHSGNQDLRRVVQTANTPALNSEFVLTGYMTACSSDINNPDRRFNHRIRVWDGSYDTTMLAEWVMPNNQHCIADWTSFSLAGTATQSKVTVEWGFQRGSDTGWCLPATHVDELSLLMGEPCPKPYGDFDRDQDVDQEDFGVWQACYTGNAGGLLPGCNCVDSDMDLDVDQTDFSTLAGCATGPGITVPQTVTPGSGDPYVIDEDCGVIQACCNEGTCADIGKGSCLAQGGTPMGAQTRCLGDLDPVNGVDDACE